MWRQVTEKIIKEEFPDVTLTHMYVDAVSMDLIRRPSEFDVILTEVSFFFYLFFFFFEESNF